MSTVEKANGDTQGEQFEKVQVEEVLPAAGLPRSIADLPGATEVELAAVPAPAAPAVVVDPIFSAAPVVADGPAGEIAPAASAVLAGIQGCFDGVANGAAKGWAIDRKAPDRKLTIEIWADETFIAAGEASQYRGDIFKSGVGDGYHAFAIDLPRLPVGTHVLRAKVAGYGDTLENVFKHVVSETVVRGGIDRIEGLTLEGWVASTSSDDVTLQIVVDGASVAVLSIAKPVPGQSNPVKASIPVSLADGRVHWFQIKAREVGQVVAEMVAVTAVVAISEEDLQRYAKDFPGFLSPSAANRVASFEGQLDVVSRMLNEGPQAPVAEYFNQLKIAYNQVKRGIAEQSGLPEKLHFPVHENPLVSVVVPAHDKFWVTYNCLAALLLAPNKSAFEVIVVDDGSRDLTTRLEDFVSGITVVRNEAGVGFVKSSNRGAEAARGEFVVMLNNDTEPCSGWIDELVHVFRSFDKVGLAGAKLVYPDGKLQEAGGIVFPNFDVSNYGRGGNQFDTRYNYTRQVDYISGACIMLRREIWNELGGFDELYSPAYYEDNDLAFRVRAKGLKTYYTPFAKVVHFEGVSSGTSLTSGAKRYQVVNEPKFRARWASAIRNLPLTLDPDLAKDRGVDLRALVIDHDVPQPDKDAGSYAARQEMRLLQALGFKVTFVPNDLAFIGNYTEDLQRDGIECLYAPFAGSIQEVIERRGQEFDIVYITRYSIANLYVDLIRKAAPRAKIIFNDADLHFLREIRAALAAKNQGALRGALETRDIELSVMRRSDVTLSYTDVEAAVILSHNLDATKVARCPWVIDVDEAIPPFASRSGLAFVGNFSHPPNEEAIRFFIRDIMPELRQELPGITLRVFGSNMPAELGELAAEDILFEGYVADVADVYHTCRVFVAPLLSGAGIKGKVVGALASGTPTIMSPIAAEGIGVSNGLEAIVAQTAAEWVAAVKALYTDEKRWTAMSEAAKRFAGRQFSFENGLTRMREALALAGVYVD
ncbi:glycosyltransferase [Rhodoblastus sp. 17X3]|uniref:glycosyltransferase n=1 Tax=Rhodoblastus sp. 17X3 TaxID=3047026 RepID=UPI0024B7896C|nr:glycosyltransferase [Rhodoblastus sp. 17X3]MDI9847784.1 glycosyltransferase [Rhodoblastus sp. 17X3]